MKIGILLRELDISGGTQRHALSLARELKLMGEDVAVYALQVDAGRCYPWLMKEVAPVDLKGLLPGVEAQRGRKIVLLPRRFLGLSPDFRLNRKIADALPGDLDILNVHEHFLYPAAVYWKERTGKPIVWFMNDVPGEFYPCWDYRRPWRKFDRIVNGKEWENRAKRRLARQFDEIVVHSRIEGAKLHELTDLSGKVITCGLDLEDFPFHPRKPPGFRRMKLFSNAILYPHRRLEDIVASLKILSERGIDFEWFHAGETSRAPDYFRRILQSVAEAGLSERVTFPGSVSEPELVRRFQEADIFLFPHTPQSWGLAVFEAMACGTPVIVSRGAGASEVLIDRKSAILVDPFSPGQIAEAVERLRDDPAMWESLHREGRRFVEENIRWDLYAARMREVFRQTVRS